MRLVVFLIALIAVKAPLVHKPTLNIPTRNLNSTISVKAVHIPPQPTVQIAAKTTPVGQAQVAPTPVAVPVTAVSYPVGCDAYVSIVDQYSWNTSIAMAIMQAESGCNPYAISNGAINYDGIPDYGLFQIHGMDILNPSANIAEAYQKYLSQGWAAWSTYNSGEYEQYL